MPPITIRLPALLADRIDGIDTVTLMAATVREAVERLAERHPELAPFLVAADGRIKSVMVVFPQQPSAVARAP